MIYLCTSLFFLNSCRPTLIIFNQIHYPTIPPRNDLSSLSVTCHGERVRPEPMRVRPEPMRVRLSVSVSFLHRLLEKPPQLNVNWHSNLPPFCLQRPTSNDPINSRRAKSSPALHFFLISEAVSLGYTSQQGKKWQSQLQFHADFKWLDSFHANVSILKWCSVITGVEGKTLKMQHAPFNYRSVLRKISWTHISTC